MDDKTPSKIDLYHTESRVVFYICDCCLDKNYSFYGLCREDAKRLMKRLQHIEKMTWKQWISLPREGGLTPERKDSDSFNMIHNQNSSERKIVEQYYFHFRIEIKGVFRVFGYQKDQFFCITHIDRNGSIHCH